MSSVHDQRAAVRVSKKLEVKNWVLFFIAHHRPKNSIMGFEEILNSSVWNKKLKLNLENEI